MGKPVGRTPGLASSIFACGEHAFAGGLSGLHYASATGGGHAIDLVYIANE